jgi:NAD-dependent dihydropyrimidine dehydrogenase PreA subunit
MIEIVLNDTCIRCSACIRACPDNVYDEGPDGVPVIARQDDCQTCFLCEAYCPVDALYVSPLKVPETGFDFASIESRGLIGSFARTIGWKRGRPAPKPAA